MARYTSWLTWAFGFGLVFYLFQLMGLPFLGWRVWTWISILAVVAVLVAIIYFWRTRIRRNWLPMKRSRRNDTISSRPASARSATDGVPVPRSPRAEKRRARTTSLPPRIANLLLEFSKFDNYGEGGTSQDVPPSPC